MPTSHIHRSTPGTGVVLAALAALFLVAPGCGMGGGGDGGPAPLSITTPALPPAGLNYTYTTTLEASGGAGGYVWTVVGGGLPPGVAVAPNGTVTATPTSLGTYTVSVEVTDSSAATDSASYSLSVMPVQVTVQALHWGKAWTGEAYSVTSVAGAGVTFAFTQNMTGGTLSNANPSAGTATYHAGPIPGTDRLRGTGTSGEIADVDVVAVKSPVGSMIARFSSTDVWLVRFKGKQGAHVFSCDFDAGLASIGLRGAASYDATGTTADQIARACVQRGVLAQSNLLYLNNADGSPAPGGLKISFPYYELPSPPYYSPADGDVDAPAPNHYNVISVHYGDGASGVIGTAYTDSTSNSWQENDTTSTTSGGPLGVFVDEIIPYFNSGFANDALPGSPVSASDVPALEAILYGTSNPGGRYDEIRRIVDGFASTVAEVVAHEIGHSLGLNHTSPAQSGSVMNASAMIGPGASFHFIPSDVTILQGGLPGPGRGGAPLYGPVGYEFLGSLLYTGHPGEEAVVCGGCETIGGRALGHEPQPTK